MISLANWRVYGPKRNFCIFSYLWQCGETWSDFCFLSPQSVCLLVITIRFEVNRRRTDHGQRLMDYTTLIYCAHINTVATAATQHTQNERPLTHCYILRVNYVDKYYSWTKLHTLIYVYKHTQALVCMCQVPVPVSSCQTVTTQTGSRLVWRADRGKYHHLL